MILASLAVFLALAAREPAPGAAPSAADAGEGGRAGDRLEEPDWSLLAIFKIQSQLIIGASAFDPSQAEELLRQLGGYAADVHTTAALAIVTQFARGDAEGRERSAAILDDAAFSREGEAFLDRIDSALEEGVTAEERSELSGELGWFAQLLPARSGDGGREPPPQASAIRSTSAAVAAALGFGMLVAFGAFLLGTGLFVAFLVTLSRRRGLLRFRPGEPGSHFLLEAFAVYLGGMAALECAALVLPRLQLGAGAMLLPVALGLVWCVWRGMPWGDFRHRLGWHRGEGWWREIGAGFVGYLGMLPIVLAGILLTLLLTFVAGEVAAARQGLEAGNEIVQEPVTHPVIGWLMQGGWGVKLSVFVLAAVMAPLFEETFFRGALHRGLRARWAFLPSALAAGLIFAVLHPQGWMAVPALTAMGVGFALIREWRDSLVAPMVAHAINNGIIVGLAGLAL